MNTGAMCVFRDMGKVVDMSPSIARFQQRRGISQLCPSCMVMGEARESWSLREEENNADPTKSFLLMP